MNSEDIQAAANALKLIRQSILEKANTVTAGLKAIANSSPELARGLSTFEHRVRTWPDWQRGNWLRAAEMGWYFNWETPISSSNAAVDQGKEALDKFMVQTLEADWEVLKTRIIELCPDRAHILNEAFALHEEGRFIASVPLFLSQSDGICAQYLRAFMFTEHEKRAENVERVLSESGDDFLRLFLAPYSEKSPFGNRIGKSSEKHKSAAPNRSGVLHGSTKHLDYGSKLNSCKSFSLLAFVVFSVVDSLEESKT